VLGDSVIEGHLEGGAELNGDSYTGLRETLVEVRECLVEDPAEEDKAASSLRNTESSGNSIWTNDASEDDSSSEGEPGESGVIGDAGWV